MGHAFDLLTMLRTTGALTQDESVGPVTVYGAMRKGLAVRVVFPPSVTYLVDTVRAKVFTSADNSTYNLVAQNQEGDQTPGATGLELIIPFPVGPGKTYVKLELNVTIASTTPGFGIVKAGVVPAGDLEWDRSTDSTMH